MRWRSNTTTCQVWSGTCDVLLETLPKEVKKLRSSWTSSLTCWSFTTSGPAVAMVEERTMMTMAARTTPRTRVHLLLLWSRRDEEWQVWELRDSVPPSTQAELEVDQGPSPREPGSRKRPDHVPEPTCAALEMEVSADGEVTQAFLGEILAVEV